MILLIAFNPFGKKKSESNKNTSTYDKVINKKIKNMDDLENILIATASKYYEENYYPSVADPEKDLEVYSEFGIKLYLNILDGIQPFNDNLNEALKKHMCNLESSRVIIIPSKPYGKTDYTTNVHERIFPNAQFLQSCFRRREDLHPKNGRVFGKVQRMRG